MVESLDLVRGTLDLLILKTLTWGRLHGYSIANSIRQRTDRVLLVEEGALYPALHRLEARGLVESEWGLSENNRRAKYYNLTVAGRERLQNDADLWTRYATAVSKILSATSPLQGAVS